jgi:hypothetical protein
MARFDVHGGVIGTLEQLVKLKLSGGWVRLSRLLRSWVGDVDGERAARGRAGAAAGRRALGLRTGLRAMAHVSVFRAGQFRFLGDLCRIYLSTLEDRKDLLAYPGRVGPDGALACGQ